MAKKITVLGATGNIGTALTHLLLQGGHAVTAVARPSARLDALAAAGATPLPGDLHDAAFLADALRGADAAFVMIPPSMAAPDVLAHYQHIGEATAAAIRATGLGQVVHLSSNGADLPAGTGPILGVHHQEARLNAVEGLAVAHLRPAYFMENLLGSVGMIRHMGITGGAMRPDLALPMIATRDIAAYAAGLLGGEPLHGHTVHNLLGPRNYSQQEATAAIGQAIGRPELPYVPFSYDDAKKGMMGAGLSESMASLYVEMTQSLNEEKLMVHEVRTAANTTPTTLETFVGEVFVRAMG